MRGETALAMSWVVSAAPLAPLGFHFDAHLRFRGLVTVDRHLAARGLGLDLYLAVPW